MKIGMRMIRVIARPIHMIPSVEPGTELGGAMGVGVAAASRERGGTSVEVRSAEPEIELNIASSPPATRTSTG